MRVQNWLNLTAYLTLMALAAVAQTPGDAELNGAYKALAKKDYDSAVALFREGLAKQPANAGGHKDLAYTLLKTGDNAEARDEFESALKLDPKDETAALEFAFLAFETKKPVAARRMFDRLRHSGSPATRQTAEQAFQNIDQPLAAGIARWQQAIQRSDKPDDLSMFSAHEELAQLAELRDEPALAAQQYEICRKLKPQLPEMLLILARVWMQLGRVEEAHAALLAASRSTDSRTAEQALEQLGPRYPYVYEFSNALKLDPQNIALLKELAYLNLAMHKDAEAAQELQQVLVMNAKDKAAREQLDVLHGFKTRSVSGAPAADASSASSALSPKAMGIKSLGLGYSKDAIKFLSQAHEADPNDTEVMLKLGWAYNLARQDDEAITWFALARKSEDPKIAEEATKAYHNLNGDVMPQTTVWSLPMYSTRWNDLFSYGQVKRSLPLPGMSRLNKVVTLYVSTRFIGDVRSSLETHTFDPQYLSESSFIFGIGASSRTWHHLTGWAEAGEAVNYLPGRTDIGAAIPDYRGGVNFAKGFGALLGSHVPGLFYETTADAIYVSRFDKDWLYYSQHRAGRTFHFGDAANLQLLWNVNYVRDSKQEYWANSLELGPGVKIHPHFFPSNLYFSADFLRGVYLKNEFNPRRPNYNDIRLSFWYARTK